MAKKATKKVTKKVATKTTKASEVAPTEQRAAVDTSPAWVDPASIPRGICKVTRAEMLKGNKDREK